MPLTMNREVFITCAVTGSGGTQDRSPHVPRSPAQIADSAIAAAKAFFALPVESKMQYKLPVGGQRGYTPFGIETAKGEKNYDLKEFWHVGRDLPAGHPLAAQQPNLLAATGLPPAFLASNHERLLNRASDIKDLKAAIFILYLSQ